MIMITSLRDILLKFAGIVLLLLAISILASSSTAYANEVGGLPGMDQEQGTDGGGGTTGGGGDWNGGGGSENSGSNGGSGGGGKGTTIGSTVRCDPLGGACSTGYSGPSTYGIYDVEYAYGNKTSTTCENVNGTLVEASAGFKLSYVLWNLGDRDSERQDYYVASPVKNCGYGTWVQTEWKKCYYDGMGSGNFSRDINEIKDNGATPVTNYKVLEGSPTSGHYGNCVGNFYHKISIPTADYGYYKMFLSNKTVEWSRKGLMYGGAEIIHKWDRMRDAVHNKYGFYSFSCQADNPYSNLTMGEGLESTHASFKSKVLSAKTDKFLDPAACPQTKGRWECTVANPTTIGLDHAALTSSNQRDASKMKATVMRNGDPVKLTYGEIKISDYNTRGEEKIVSEGQSGSVVKNLRHVSYRDSIVGRSSNKVASGTPATPWKANTDVNAKDQYFARYVDKNNKMNSANFSKDWDKWIYKNANDNRNYLMSFNWASDKGAPFATTREYQVTADFLVPSGSSGGLNSDGSFTSGAIQYDWKKDTRICYEKTGSGGNLTETTNPVYSKSNMVDVMRATSNNG